MIIYKTALLIGLTVSFPVIAGPNSLLGSAVHPGYGPGIGLDHCMAIAIGHGQQVTGTGHIVAQGGHAMAVCHASSYGRIRPCPPPPCKPQCKRIQRVAIVQNTQDTLIAIHHTKRLQTYLQPTRRMQYGQCNPIDWSSVGITLP